MFKIKFKFKVGRGQCARKMKMEMITLIFGCHLIIKKIKKEI
jgi:hypothetical protein